MNNYLVWQASLQLNAGSFQVLGTEFTITACIIQLLNIQMKVVIFNTSLTFANFYLLFRIGGKKKPEIHQSLSAKISHDTTPPTS